MGKLSTVAPYKEGGIVPGLQKWLDILFAALRGDITTDGLVNGVDIAKLTTIKNTTSETSDYALSVGETAQIDITAASTALNIAVEDGWYDLTFEFDSTTFLNDRAIVLQVNNTTYTNEFLATRFGASTGFATDEVDTSDLTTDTHPLTFGLAGATTLTPYRIDCRLVISGNRTSLFSVAYGNSGASRIVSQICSIRTATPAHTSLGTLSIVEVATGTAYVKRLA